MKIPSIEHSDEIGQRALTRAMTVLAGWGTIPAQPTQEEQRIFKQEVRSGFQGWAPRDLPPGQHPDDVWVEHIASEMLPVLADAWRATVKRLADIPPIPLEQLPQEDQERIKVINRIYELTREPGVSLEAACVKVGVADNVYRNWRSRYRQFYRPYVTWFDGKKGRPRKGA